MLKRLSGASDAQLQYYLARVREIASLGDEAALIETDKLLWETGGSDADDETEGLGDKATFYSTVTDQDGLDYCIINTKEDLEYYGQKLKVFQ